MSEVISRRRGRFVTYVQRVVTAGNGRSVILKRDGKVVVEVPLATSVLGIVPAVLLAPELTAVTAIVALVAKCTIEVKRASDGT